MSDMRNYTDLYPYLTPKLPRCPKPQILQTIKEVVHRFTKETEAWQMELEPLPLIEGKLSYYLYWCEKARLSRIVWVKVNTNAGVDAGNEGELVPDDKYTFTEPNLLTLDDDYKPAEDISRGLTIKIALFADMDATKIDWDFFNSYSDGIIGGVLSDLMLREGKPWTSGTEGNTNRNRYNRGKQGARAELSKGRRMSAGRFGA